MELRFWMLLPSFVSSVASTCHDLHDSCNTWAFHGYCAIADHDSYMYRDCKETCGLCNPECLNNHASCEVWAILGECERSYRYMSINCKRSCGQCKSSSTQPPKQPSVELPYIRIDLYRSAVTNTQQKNVEEKPSVTPHTQLIDELPYILIDQDHDPSAVTTSRPKTTKNQLTFPPTKLLPQLPYILIPIGRSTDTTNQQRDIYEKTQQFSTLNCGHQENQEEIPPFYRIIGGQSKGAGRWPWQVGLYQSSYQRRPYCGGTLIRPNVVLTAAHCRPRPGHLVKIGDYDLREEESTEQTLLVMRVFVHDSFSMSSQRSDIALLVLSSSVEVGNGVNTVCLPTYTPPDGSQCYVTGWGNDGRNRLAATLKEAKIPIVSRSLCNQRYQGKVTRNMLCAGYPHGRVDACEGDSGGPLVCENGGKFFLHGITSWGFGCGKSYSPGVYTNVSKYVEWIMEKSNMDAETYKHERAKSFNRLIQFLLASSKTAETK